MKDIRSQVAYESGFVFKDLVSIIGKNRELVDQRKTGEIVQLVERSESKYLRPSFRNRTKTPL